jgi:hypothetical protein
LLRFCSAQRVRELQSDLSLHHCSRSRLERMKTSGTPPSGRAIRRPASTP